ncbi:MAG: 1-acyl-sn-glycerol-3-phosphate acyltransferase [Alphaproteobacteria bacterium]|nr:1-acyl-sn-glycerol-3-phosphate acyltransferase [Alphaproteobacteria bacterium]
MIVRALFFVFVLLPYVAIGLPIQFLITRLNLPFWNALPLLFHRLACVCLGLRVTTIGRPEKNRPALLVSNHISWTDIIVIGSVIDVTFVAKSDIARWPVVGFMATMQKTIYVDRTRRRDPGRTSREMASRLASGGDVLLFAEGQSDIGTHVLPFRSSLVGSAQTAMIESGARNVVIQPIAIAYTHLQGMPVSRNERAMIAWIKSKSVGENIKDLLTGSVKSVTVAFGEPKPLSEAENRKAITKRCEDEVRHMLVTLNRGGKLTIPTA